MDPLNPMASTLDPAIAQIYSQASSIRETLRESIPPPDSEEGKKVEAEQRRQRTKELAVEVMSAPERIRILVSEGKTEEAEKYWEMPRRLLLSWKERGVGGEEVQECLDEGDAALRPASGSHSSSSRPSRDGE